MSNENKLSIIVAIIGRPNVGKSMLLNHVIGQKIAAVTYKAQTTRNIIKGIICKDNIQIIFKDSPGIFQPKRSMEKLMVKAAWSSIIGADLVIILIDSTKPVDNLSLNVIARIKQDKIPYLIVQNKIDKINSDIKQRSIELDKNNIINISAKTGENINSLIDIIKSKAQNRGWVYNEDEITDAPIRFLAEEITREQLYFCLNEEIPYRIAVQTELWKSRHDNSLEIRQAIIVTSESYKKIIIGFKGKNIKNINIRSRQILEEELQSKVHLFFFVKVRKNWEKNHLYLSY